MTLHADYQRHRREDKRQAVASYKESRSCTDCGGFFPAPVMDFDHSPGTKFRGISRMMRDKYSMERILEEMEKCDLVCANCHRIRTHRRNSLT